MTPKSPLPRARSALREFLNSEAAGGILLIGAAVLAMLIANSDAADAYYYFQHLETGPVISPLIGPMTVHFWINDGLMALFFLLVGLEIKRELIDGHLANWSDRWLPLAGAVGGMALPALIFLGIANGDPAIVRGWAIPAATDIAFAIGVLAMLGRRAPASLKLLLTTIAIIDDMGAVAIIALFYTEAIDVTALGAAAAILAVMVAMGRSGVSQIRWYLIGFALLWYAMMLSGVHATIAGVLTAFAVPFTRTKGSPDADHSTLHRLEHHLAKPVAYLIVPLFGFVNAGISLAVVSLASVVSPLPLGIALGLFLGKQIGIFAGLRGAVAIGVAAKPEGASWTQVYGMALLCGIGFTMSLFIGSLAFPDHRTFGAVKLGVLSGTLLSTIAGVLLLCVATKPTSQRSKSDT